MCELALNAEMPGEEVSGAISIINGRLKRIRTVRNGVDSKIGPLSLDAEGCLCSTGATKVSGCGPLGAGRL
jgi:hypothetical protein